MQLMRCVQWWTGPPGHREKSRWAGPPEWVIFWPPGPLVHYNKLIKFRSLVTLLILEYERYEIFNTWSELLAARHRPTLMEDGLSACQAACLAALDGTS